ncbi:MAG: sigma-70 family RNA polymerase sigma factor [Planctomycetes bacterium]|nr:sigma-70 family RNA polymerase sigma factor [Planctomycetota bacterium]
MSEVTRILKSLEEGDPQAADDLLPLVYDELRRLAAAKMAREKPGQTLQATALVHEAYVRLVDPQGQRCWNDRRHFFLVAAEAMRRILISNARRKNATKRGGDHKQADIDPDDLAASIPSEQLLALSDSLDELTRRHPDKAQLVKLRYFGGLTVAEAAEALGISSTTAERHWAYARAWLQCQIAE